MKKLFLILSTLLFSLLEGGDCPTANFVSFYNFALEAQWNIEIDLNTSSTLISEEELQVRREGKDGDLVVIQADRATPDFFKYVPEKGQGTTKGYIFAVCSDYSFPDEFKDADLFLEALEDGRIVHLFVTNADLSRCPKNVTQLPIGLNYQKPLESPKAVGYDTPVLPEKQDEKLKEIIESLQPTDQRLIRPYCDFSLTNSSKGRKIVFGEDRSEIAEKLQKSKVCDFLVKRVPVFDLLGEKGRRAFDISPPGVGVNCYRTWEGLIMGCIVIVKSSFLDPLYEGLPVVIVKDWSEVTEANLKRWLDEYGDVFHNSKMREKLTHEYWMSKIKKVQSEYREKALAKNT